MNFELEHELERIQKLARERLDTSPSTTTKREQ